MLADFWGPYFVTIAGVATTGIVAFLGRFIWRWATAAMPTVVHLELLQSGIKVINRGDFTVHLLAFEILEPPPGQWRINYEKPRRIASGRYTSFGFDPEGGIVMRVDRSYRIHAPWRPLRALGGYV